MLQFLFGGLYCVEFYAGCAWVHEAAVIDSGSEIQAAACGWPKKAPEKVSIMRNRGETRKMFVVRRGQPET